MKISVQFGALTKRFGPEVSFKMLADAGFESCDYSLTDNMFDWETPDLTDVTAPNFREHFENIANIAKENHIEIGMTHAPYCMVFRSDHENTCRRSGILSRQSMPQRY